MCDGPTFVIPGDALSESYRLLALEGVSLADYASAAQELISGLIDQGLLHPTVSGIRNRSSAANQEYTRSIRAAFEARADRLDRC